MFGKPGSDANKHLLRLRSRRLRALRPRALWLSLKCDQYHVVTILSNSGAAKAAWFSALPETTTCVIGSPMAPCSVKSVGGMSEKLLRSGSLKVPRTELLASYTVTLHSGTTTPDVDCEPLKPTISIETLDTGVLKSIS